MAKRLLDPGFRLLDSSANPISGGTLEFYESGTTTPKSVFSDPALSASLGTVVTTNAAGYPASSGTRVAVWGDGEYKLVAKDATGVTLWTDDPVTAVDAIVTVDTVAELKALDPNDFADGDVVIVNGYNSTGDGGGGLFRWDSASTTADDGGTVIAPSVGGTGRWKRNLDKGFVTPQMWGAKADGATNDTTAIQNAIDWAVAQSGGVVFLPAGNYLFDTITINGDGVDLVGESGNSTKMTCQSTTASAILVTHNLITIRNINLFSTSARSAVAPTTYSDTTPTAGIHGISCIRYDRSTTQARITIDSVTVHNQPDDGFFFDAPEKLYAVRSSADACGRFGWHVNGKENSIGISNYLLNCRAINCTDRGFYVRETNGTTLVNPQSLSSGVNEMIYIHGGKNHRVINADVEWAAFKSGIVGIKVVGQRHTVETPYLFNVDQPVVLSSATDCTITSPHATVSSGTMTQIVFMDSSSTNNRISVDPTLPNATRIINFYGSWGLGNRIFPVNADGIRGIGNGDTTPYLPADGMYKTANTAATTITSFEPGFTGQTVTILFTDANTTIGFASGGNIRGNGGVNWTAGVNDALHCVYDGTNWQCSVING